MVRQGHPGGPAAEAKVMRAVLLAALDRLEAGEWEAAHALVQSLGTKDGAWVHAHLHRAEGDPTNARFWYDKAGRPMPDGDLGEERSAIREAIRGARAD